MHKTKFTKLLCLVLSLVMILCAAPITVFAATVSVEYIFREWNETTKKVVESVKYADCTVLDNNTKFLAHNAWYVVKDNVTLSNRLSVNNGKAYIILADGAKLTATNGIQVDPASELHIYGQSYDIGMIDATGVTYAAGIGAGAYAGAGTITVYGGTIKATGGENGAGIGGSYFGDGGTVNIYGGTVTAIGGENGAGIGGGATCTGTVNIYGGTVTATGGEGAAGIGGGGDGDGGLLTVNGGTVTAIGGKNGAGIGGGMYGMDCGIATINGGTVTATGGENGAGIGGGYYVDGSKVTVNGGTVTAIGGLNAFGIGYGYDDGYGSLDNGTLTVSSDAVILAGTSEATAATVVNADFCDDHTTAYVNIEVKVQKHAHKFAAGWSTDANGHWHACTAADCDITSYATCGLVGAAYGTHTFENGKCTVCEAKAPCTHAHKEIINAVTATCVDEGYTGDVFCIDCETIIEEGTSTLIDPDNHAGSAVLDDSTVVAATCISGGYSGDYYCECCNELIILGDDTDIDPNNHAGSAVLDDSTVVAATCISAGYTGDKICDACNEIVISGTSTDIDPNNHAGEAVLDDSTVVAATCISAGYTGDKICDACNEIVISGTPTDIDPANHVGAYNTVEAAATCTEAGHTGGKYCPDCNKWITAEEVIPALEHKNAFAGEAKDATCTKAGNTAGLYCPDCDQWIEAQEVIPATGIHTGMDDFICDVCEYYDEAGALAAAKAAGKAEVNALVDDTSSDAVKAIVAQAVEDIDAAESIEEVTSIVEAAKKAVAEQKAAEENPVEPDGDACPKCGGHHGNSFFDRIVCLITRIINLFISKFDTVC